MKQISFSGNLEQDRNKQMFLIIEEARETNFDFSKGAVKAFLFYFVLI